MISKENAVELLKSYNEFCDKYDFCNQCPNRLYGGACKIAFGYNAALEAKAKKPTIARQGLHGNFEVCPDCGKPIFVYENFCSKCGTKIDWSDYLW